MSQEAKKETKAQEPKPIEPKPDNGTVDIMPPLKIVPKTITGRNAATMGPIKRPLNPKDPMGPRDPRDMGRWPKIKDKICEFCGTDYRSCKHYGNFGVLYCKFCGMNNDETELNMNGRTITVLQFVDSPERLMTVCDDYKCRLAFEKEHARKAA